MAASKPVYATQISYIFCLVSFRTTIFVSIFFCSHALLYLEMSKCFVLFNAENF